MGVSRQLILCIDPRSDAINTISFSSVPDGNSSGKIFTCAYVPPAKGSGISITQETMFIGAVSEVGTMFQALKQDVAMDGASNVVSEFITQRLDPDNRIESGRRRSNSTKRYLSVQFNGTIPGEKGVELSWLKDTDPIESNSVSWTTFATNTGDTLVEFESGLADWVHLRGVHNGATGNEVHLDNFSLHFVRVGEGREGRDS